MIDTIILAGGKGTRMETDRPKALAIIAGQTLIERQINKLLKSPSIGKIIIAVGVSSELVIGYVSYTFKDFIDKKIFFSLEDKPLGTGGAIKKALKQVNSSFVYIFNVDDLTEIQPFEADRMENTIFLSNLRSPYGTVYTHGNDVIGFEEKPILKDIWVSIGHSVINVDTLKSILPDVGSFEFEALPKIHLKAIKHKGAWITINTQKEREEANRYFDRVANIDQK